MSAGLHRSAVGGDGVAIIEGGGVTPEQIRVKLPKNQQ